MRASSASRATRACRSSGDSCFGGKGLDGAAESTVAWFCFERVAVLENAAVGGAGDDPREAIVGDVARLPAGVEALLTEGDGAIPSRAIAAAVGSGCEDFDVAELVKGGLVGVLDLLLVGGTDVLEGDVVVTGAVAAADVSMGGGRLDWTLPLAALPKLATLDFAVSKVGVVSRPANGSSGSYIGWGRAVENPTVGCIGGDPNAACGGPKAACGGRGVAAGNVTGPGCLCMCVGGGEKACGGGPAKGGGGPTYVGGNQPSLPLAEPHHQAPV